MGASEHLGAGVLSHEEPVRQAAPGAEMKVKFAFEQLTLKGEDEVVIQSPSVVNGISWHMFAVLDGHQGPKCAKFVKERLWKAIKEKLPTVMPSSWESPAGAIFADDVSSAIIHAFDVVDRKWYVQNKPSGTTATVALLTGKLLTVANVGDSSAYLQMHDDNIEMTVSHRLDSSESEIYRLNQEQVHLAPLGAELQGPAKEGEDGFGPTRIWPGGLAVGRSIGDADVTPQVVCFPHVKQVVLPDGGGRVLMASDGLWDALPCSRILKISRKKRVTKLPGALMHLVAHVNGGAVRDDTSIISIDILPSHLWDFKALRKTQTLVTRVVGCLQTETADHCYPLFSEMDSLERMEVSFQRRLQDMRNEGTLRTASWSETGDYTVHNTQGSKSGRKSGRKSHLFLTTTS